MSEQPAEDRLVSIKEIVRRSSLSRTTIYKLIEAGELPRPIRLTPSRVAIPERAISAWLSAKAGVA